MKTLSLFLLLASTSIIGCASAETAATDNAALTSDAAQVFAGTTWTVDPVLNERWGDEQPDRVIVVLRAEQGLLQATLVHGLLPEFYATTITKTTVDACGAVHYEGVSEQHPDWPDTSWTLNVVDRSASQCPDRDATATLDTIHYDGRATHSVLQLTPS